MPAFGDQMRARRDELGLTQREVAAELGVSSATVSRWERGIDLPGPDRARELGRFMERSPAEILDLLGDRAPTPDSRTVSARLADIEGALASLRATVEALGATVAGLQGSLGALQGACASGPTQLSDDHGNSITLGPEGIRIDAVSNVEVVAAVVDVGQALTEVRGLLKSTTVMAETVVAGTYSPGAGNIW